MVLFLSRVLNLCHTLQRKNLKKVEWKNNKTKDQWKQTRLNFEQNKILNWSELHEKSKYLIILKNNPHQKLETRLMKKCEYATQKFIFLENAKTKALKYPSKFISIQKINKKRKNPDDDDNEDNNSINLNMSRAEKRQRISKTRAIRRPRRIRDPMEIDDSDEDYSE